LLCIFTDCVVVIETVICYCEHVVLEDFDVRICRLNVPVS